MEKRGALGSLLTFSFRSNQKSNRRERPSGHHYSYAGRQQRLELAITRFPLKNDDVFHEPFEISATNYDERSIRGDIFPAHHTTFAIQRLSEEHDEENDDENDDENDEDDDGEYDDAA